MQNCSRWRQVVETLYSTKVTLTKDDDDNDNEEEEEDNDDDDDDDELKPTVF